MKPLFPPSSSPLALENAQVPPFPKNIHSLSRLRCFVLQQRDFQSGASDDPRWPYSEETVPWSGSAPSPLFLSSCVRRSPDSFLCHTSNIKVELKTDPRHTWSTLPVSLHRSPGKSRKFERNQAVTNRPLDPLITWSPDAKCNVIPFRLSVDWAVISGKLVLSRPPFPQVPYILPTPDS